MPWKQVSKCTAQNLIINLHVAYKLQKSSRIFKFDSAAVCLHGVTQWYIKISWWGWASSRGSWKQQNCIHIASSCGFMYTAPVGSPQADVDLLWKNMPIGVTVAGSFDFLCYMCVLFSNNNICIWVWLYLLMWCLICSFQFEWMVFGTHPSYHVYYWQGCLALVLKAGFCISGSTWPIWKWPIES